MVFSTSRAFTAAAISVAALGGTLFFAAPASAVSAPGHCVGGYACIDENINYKGGQQGFERRVDDYAAYRYGGIWPVNDTASSIVNNGKTGVKAEFFVDSKLRGTSVFLRAGYGDANLHDTSGEIKVKFHDRISSAHFLGY